MKILTFILSLYVLVLTAIPCVDVPKDNNVQKIVLAQSSTDNHQNDVDSCSLFCTCYYNSIINILHIKQPYELSITFAKIFIANG